MCWQGQAKLVDHVRKSYSVNDLSLENSTDFDDNRERMDDSDDELDNRLIAEQYKREVAAMTAAGSDAHPRPGLNNGQIWISFCISVSDRPVDKGQLNISQADERVASTSTR